MGEPVARPLMVDLWHLLLHWAGLWLSVWVVVVGAVPVPCAAPSAWLVPVLRLWMVLLLLVLLVSCVEAPCGVACVGLVVLRWS